MKPLNLLLCLVTILALTAIGSAAPPKQVYAHYMLWVPSTSDSVSGFMSDMRLAQSVGIDGFVLNSGQWSAVDWVIPRCDKIWQAAENLNSSFKLFFSVDLTGSLGSMPADIVSMIARYAHRPNTLKVDGKVFVSTFVGQDKTFGYATPQLGWQQAVITPLRNQGIEIYFVPFFAPRNIQPVPAGQIGYPGQAQVADVFATFPYLDGLFQWGAWPYFYGNLQNASQAADLNYLAAARALNKTYMAPISPWFAKHMAGAPNDVPNWVFGNYGGPKLYIDHWRWLISQQPDLIEIVTWNDYPERSYIGPTTAPWGAEEVTTYPHVGFLNMTRYFIEAFKSGGVYPAITEEKVFVFYRASSKNAIAPNDTLGPQTNCQAMDDNIYVVALLRSSATITITTGPLARDFTATAGLSYNITLPFREGAQSVRVRRSGRTLGQRTFAKAISNKISVYDCNVFSDVLVLSP